MVAPGTTSRLSVLKQGGPLDLDHPRAPERGKSSSEKSRAAAATRLFFKAQLASAFSPGRKAEQGRNLPARELTVPELAWSVSLNILRPAKSSIKATIFSPNQVLMSRFNQRVCDRGESGEREGTQQIQSRSLGGRG
jgi:hypothetical protein